MKRRILLIGLITFVISGLVACGGKAATVSITDDGLKTELETKLPNTVSKIIEEAGISLGIDDVVTPGLDEKLSEATEIVIERKHTVNLTVDGKTQSYDVVGGTVADLLEASGVKLSDKQITSVDLTEPLKNGMTVEILEQLSVAVTCDGETKNGTVNAITVGDAIKELGITLGEDDEVTPAVDQRVTEGMEITIDRVKYETVTETVAVDYEIEYQYDGNSAVGTEYTSVYGEEGEMEVTYRTKYVNGEEEETEVIEEKITKEPVTAVVVIGTYEAPAQTQTQTSGKVEVSRVNCPDCDGSGHGYWEITYSDGTVGYEEY